MNSVIYARGLRTKIEKILPLFIIYWNGTGHKWTSELVYKRIWQVFGSPDSYCMIAETHETILGFALGRFETFYDLAAYNLIEIVIATEYQNRGFSSKMMIEIEKRVREKGASMVQLQSVNDEMHEHFYENLGYQDATNWKLKAKFL